MKGLTAVAGPVVSMVRYRDARQSLRRAIELCGGLAGFKPGDRILIKPNLVEWDFDSPFPPFGVVTTSAVVFALVEILAEEGFNNITIGEAALPYPETMGRRVYRALGYEKLTEAYGVQLVDFNEEEFVPVDFGDVSLAIARRALEADRVINLPVLKTHSLCKVSLGLKNLKGCLDRKSKTICHHKDLDLNHIFPRLMDAIPVALTVIDGIFTLARGPASTGTAYRKDLLLASGDALACDAAGAEIMGYPAEEVPHLRYYAGRHGRSLKLADIDIRGEEEPARHRFSVDYDWEWADDDTGPAGFKKRGITGLALRKYDNSMCTGCSYLYNIMVVMLMSAYKGEPFPGIEIITGKRRLAGPGFAKTVLFGRCACTLNKDNPHIKKAIPIRGCPPDLKKFEKAMREEGIDCRYDDYLKYRRGYFDRHYKDREGFDMDLFLK